MKNSSGRRETNSSLQPLPKISRRTLLKGTLAAGSLALPSSLATASATPLVNQGDAVKVGAIYDTQGDLKLYGDQQIDAAKVAIAEINEAGGLLGKTIELV